MSWRDELKNALEERPDYKALRDQQAIDDEDDEVEEQTSTHLRAALNGLREAVRANSGRQRAQDMIRQQFADRPDYQRVLRNIEDE